MGKNVVFALNKTLELKAENENMLICREREREIENGQRISLCER